MRIRVIFVAVIGAALLLEACKVSPQSQILGMSPKEYYSQFGYTKTGGSAAAQYHYLGAQNVPIQNYPDGRKVIANISIFLMPKFNFVLGYDELLVCADGKTITDVTRQKFKGQATLYGTSIEIGDIGGALADTVHPETTINIEFAKNLIRDGLKRKVVAFTSMNSPLPMKDILNQQYTIAQGGLTACTGAPGSSSQPAGPAASASVTPSTAHASVTVQ